ncbi:hypothetical protein DPMN_181543 [Dreissena polymorpha]|uniref:B box-type domain-containing protein n=1 Tax=Dreissena polymorpha TaxID=45954 RepID=A0A9D4DDX5_DREPO|nr:hypothetical protein DPMN_181543 [Dreissena polymorpha]
MSSFPKSSHECDSDSWDHHCTICKDKRAEFYCTNCQKCYCQQCIHPHDETFFRHIKHGRDKVDSWPQQCKVHTDNYIDLHCFDHHQPCCYRCAFHYHRNCDVKTLIPGSVLSVQENKQAFIVEKTSKHNVQIPEDKVRCFITGICALADGQVILADWDTKTVKLLDEHYQVVSNIPVAAAPWDICQVTSNKAALTVGKHIQFVKVNDTQLAKGRCFPLTTMNESVGIAHHKGHLFITSGTALREYMENGTWLCKLYEDTSNERTVWKCVVSFAGDKVYVSQPSLHTLLTLDLKGNILAIFHDPGLLRPGGVCVAPEGQIIVCGDGSDTVMLVDSDGKTKLATLATFSNGCRWPWSVYYTKNTATIIVGQWYDTIVGLKIKEREKGPFIRLKCQKNKFLILKYTCETIEGILTICRQDLKATELLDDKLHSFMSEDYIQVYTTEQLLNHFETVEMEENQGMSANSVVASIAQTSTLTLIIVKDDMCKSIINALKTSVICNAGVLIVGNMKEWPIIPNVFFGMTESEKILKEADYVFKRCACGILKQVIAKLKEFAENSGIFSELKNASLQEVYTSVKAYFENTSIPYTERLVIPSQKFEYPKNIDKAIEVIKSIPSIIGCVKKNGKLKIYIKESPANSDVENNVQRELDNYKVSEKDFVYRTSFMFVRRFGIWWHRYSWGIRKEAGPIT